ncbi:translation initiation factor IF-2 [Arenimonas sp.]|nr:translation initiation factor IF-2 [Candidatus Parcubacteria bacterium]
MIPDKNQNDDSAFGGVFGNAFGSVFGENKTPEVKEEIKSSAKTKKTSIKPPTIITPRTSSRTFAVSKEVEDTRKTKVEEHNNWFENASKFYENKNKPIETKLEEKKVEEIKHDHKPTPKYSPTLFKSKVITKEEKIDLQKKEDEKKKIEERGIAFAKTFLNNKTKDSVAGTTSPRKPFVKRDTAPRTEYVPYYKRPRVAKVKKAATLRTRISGKSSNLIKTIQILDGLDIRSKNPVVIIMGHVDHGKSTLLDYIRKANTADREVGGITQKMSAYEINHKDGKITFLDTPGHESFTSMRDRGAKAADIAILVVSAEDGVKPQTLDALKSITDAQVPFFIGVSKIDKAGADLEKTKQSLAENNIFVEGYGGDISFIPFSGKTGEGVDDLLDMILLMTEVADIKAAYDVPAECIVIESGRDKIRGIHATMIVKNGTLKVGSFIVSNGEISPVRIIENFEGKAQKSFEPGQPVRLIGWIATPKVGDICIMCEDKETAELLALEQKNISALEDEVNAIGKVVATKIPLNIRALYGLEVDNNWTLPIVLKTDSVGTLDAVKQEIGKIKFENIELRIVRAETGDINENDVKLAQGSKDSVIVGYNTKVDNVAKNLANQLNLKIETFDIIYKLSEWLENEARSKAPKILEEESHGTLKVLKIFNANKTKQVLGGLVVTGRINLGDKIKIMRRDNEIGRGEIVELQHARSQVKSVEADTECGLMIEAKIEIVTGDIIAAFSVVEK